MNKSLFLSALILSLLLPPSARALVRGAGSLQAVFTSTIVSGTCSSAIKSASGADITNGSLDFGDIYKNDVVQKTKIENFHLSFTHCTGVSGATVTTNAGAAGACSGTAFSSTTDTTGAAVEIWTGSAVSGTQLNCASAATTKQTFNPNTSPDLALSARMVLADSKTSAELKSGTFSAPVVFTVEYQ